jgi:hypothetical protein
MKSVWIATIASLAAGLVLANPERPREAGVIGMVGAETATVMPISIDAGEARSPMRLRDALRQPFDDMDDGGKPFRLSVEERQRLREQLRVQPPLEAYRQP